MSTRQRTEKAWCMQSEKKKADAALKLQMEKAQLKRLEEKKQRDAERKQEEELRKKPEAEQRKLQVSTIAETKVVLRYLPRLKWRKTGRIHQSSPISRI